MMGLKHAGRFIFLLTVRLSQVSTSFVSDLWKKTTRTASSIDITVNRNILHLIFL